ncbi:protein transport protein SEC31 [Drosophila hydei]|uniref:Protein transport protein SEC31 n=1 Tax=Drosophila hydei TaxID=7224 RepID=A0A6J2SUY0_DROHY|nr:protein transport protein SEC31 [Drosophila hydei]
MFVYQVLFLPWLLLAFDLGSAQCPSSVAASAPCLPHCVLYNGACVQPTSPCGVVAPCPTVPVQTLPCPNLPTAPAQSLPCPIQPVAPCPTVPVQTLACPNLPTAPAQSLPCPIQPVAPCPTVPVQTLPCPNLPTAPAQSLPCPIQPVAPCPTVPVQTLPCPNLPTAPAQSLPCPIQPVAPCPTVPVQTLPCPNLPTAPAQSLPCPIQPVAPSPAVPVQTLPCPVAPYPTVPPQTLPCPSPPPPIFYPTVQPHTTTTTITTTTTTTTRRPTTEPPPAPLRKCPKGTVLIKDECHLIYCGRGVYDSNNCVEPRCPKGTYWSGQKCVYPQPVEIGPIHIERTIIQESKQPHDLVLNNLQHLTVNASLTLPTDYRDYVEESEEEVIDPPISQPSPKCCTVIAPRTCRRPSESNRWQCFNPKQHVCDDFCSAPKMALRPSGISSWYDSNVRMLTIPPNWNSECQTHGNCPPTSDRYDCSGCASGRMASCSSYCYNYRCHSPKCAYYDQKEFCDSPQFAGSVGCRPEYGWRR